MIDYSKMSIMDLEQYKETLLNQRNKIDNTMENVVNNIKAKKLQTNNETLRLNPYYKDKSTCLKIIVRDDGRYIVTKVTHSGKCIGIYQFITDTIDFLKYYKICAKSEWESAMDRLNIWFKDANLKIKEL